MVQFLYETDSLNSLSTPKRLKSYKEIRLAERPNTEEGASHWFRTVRPNRLVLQPKWGRRPPAVSWISSHGGAVEMCVSLSSTAKPHTTLQSTTIQTQPAFFFPQEGKRPS